MFQTVDTSWKKIIKLGVADPKILSVIKIDGIMDMLTEANDLLEQVRSRPSHLLDRISPVFSPFFPVFCAFSPPRRDGSNEPQAGTQGQETAGTRAKSSELPPFVRHPRC